MPPKSAFYCTVRNEERNVSVTEENTDGHSTFNYSDIKINICRRGGERFLLKLLKYDQI